MNNWKESRIYKENVRNLQDTLQRAREQVSRINREQEHCERLKSKETPMLVNIGIQNNIAYYCPNCVSNKIKADYNYCPTCGQRLLWADIYDTRTTVEDGENADRKD